MRLGSEPSHPKQPEGQPQPLDVEEIAETLAPEGLLARAHPAYEDRPSQRDMARAVADAYNERRVLLAEAGTGTGKSIAYLVPAIRWAADNEERTVVSTNTINLQEQLTGKDLPFLRKSLLEPVRFALVKGRRNYVSIRRALLAHQTGASLFDDGSGERRELDSIVEWIRTTNDGSRQDLPFRPSGEVWDQVASETDVCLRKRCPHFESCFYQRARRDAAGAGVLVVNHHLLFSDLAVRRSADNYDAPAVLPPYRRIVLDEAHNLEDAATSHLGIGISRRGLVRLLGRLDRRGKGVLAAVEERLKAGEADLLQEQALEAIRKSLRPAVTNARERGTTLFHAVAGVLREGRGRVVRIDDALTRQPEWERTVAAAAHDLVVVLERLARGVGRLGETIRYDEERSRALEDQLLELEACATRLRGAADAIRVVVESEESGGVAMVRWVEPRGSGGSGGSARSGNPESSGGSENSGYSKSSGTSPSPENSGSTVASAPAPTDIALRAAPVELAGLLREALFERVDTAVLTSATLTTRDGFGFLRSRLGLAAGGLRYREHSFESSFDFASQAMLAVATDLPPPGAGRGHHRATASVVRDMVDVTDGGILVLFTSYAALRAVADALRANAGFDGRRLLVQGETSRGRLLETFASSGRAVLLGVDSFWEGVDVPGEPLRGLIITKLPFKVPDEPITAARIEAVEREGGNSFGEYMLPHAALRLKQGFGRLIRSRTDRGAVVLLDGRVATRRYGGYLLESLPPAPVSVGPWPQLAAELRSFYDRPRRPATTSS